MAKVETDALAGPKAETEETEASTDEMRQCPFDDPSQGQFARLAETGITPSTEINEGETVLKTQKEREEIEAKREKNDETGRLRKNGKKEDVEDDQNHGIEMLLPLTLTERLNSTKKEKSAEEKGESAEIAIVMSEIPTKRKRNAEKEGGSAQSRNRDALRMA